MEKKEIKVTFRCDEALKLQFDAVCKKQDITPSQIFRQLMRHEVERYGIEAAQGDLLKEQKRKK